MQLYMGLSMNLASPQHPQNHTDAFQGTRLCPHGASLPNPGVTDYEGLPFSCLTPITWESRDKSVSCDTVLGTPGTLQALRRHL